MFHLFSTAQQKTVFCISVFCIRFFSCWGRCEVRRALQLSPPALTDISCRARRRLLGIGSRITRIYAALSLIMSLGCRPLDNKTRVYPGNPRSYYKKTAFFRPEMKKSLEKFAYVKDTLYLCSVKRRGKIFDREEPNVWEQKTLWLQRKSLYSVGRRMRGRRETREVVKGLAEVVKGLAEVVREVTEVVRGCR